jgi:hypothetical protein
MSAPSQQPDEERLLAVIPRADRQELRVTLRSWGTFRGVDLRVWVPYRNGTVGPSKQGVLLKWWEVPKVIGAFGVLRATLGAARVVVSVPRKEEHALRVAVEGTHEVVVRVWAPAAGQGGVLEPTHQGVSLAQDEMEQVLRALVSVQRELGGAQEQQQQRARPAPAQAPSREAWLEDFHRRQAARGRGGHRG